MEKTGEAAGLGLEQEEKKVSGLDVSLRDLRGIQLGTLADG